jgi:hypothetical protein
MSEPATPEAALSLTREQAVLIASRLFAAYLLFWVITDTIVLPRQIIDVVHTLNQSTAMGRSMLSAINAPSTMRLYIIYLTENVLRITLSLMAAGWFYRCTPRIRNFFAAVGQ